MAKEKKEEIKLDETNVDLTKPLEEQDTEPSKEDDKENISKEDTEKKEDAKNEVLDLDNKPINEDVIKESEEVPVGFVPPIPVVEKTKETLKVRNGRVYKELKNGIGIFADTGETFKI